MSFYIQGIVFDELSSDPAGPVEGQLWYNTTEKRYKAYRDGTVRAFNDKAELDAHIDMRANPHHVSLEEARQEYSTLSGTIDMDGNKITGVGLATEDGDVASWGVVQEHVTSRLNGLDWQESVLTQVEEDPTSITPSDGDRYIVPSSGTGDWSSHVGHIAEWNGTSWDYILPNEGFTTHVEDESVNYTFPSSGTGWVTMGSVYDHGTLQGLGDDDHSQYLTTARANTWLGTKDTDDLSEGSSNLYYTEARVSANSSVVANTNHAADLNNPHQTSIGTLASGTLAELNSLITDATLDDSGDPRTPTAHASSHESGGSDTISHDSLTGAGSYSHAQLDTHYESTANPHEVGLEQARQEYSTLSGTIDMDSNKILNVGVPTLDSDAVNKLYADGHMGGITISGSGPTNGQHVSYDGVADTWNYVDAGGTGPGGSAKAGQALNAAFSGSPKTVSVVFSSAYTDTNYSISLSSETTSKANYSPSVENVTTAGFDINMGANNINKLTKVLWMTMPFGE